ncbi:MAG TPA: ATP-binding protein, partial [Casimicrobiaceae bacterium]|nr:ATP-binding protein [Casimicrobiaceae bacterium]
MNAPTTITNLTLEPTRQHLRRLGLYGLLAQAETLLNEPWLARVLEIEDTERARRSLKRRLDNARLGAFKPITDFDWAWPTKCDRTLIEELFSLGFVEEAANVVLFGLNGLGKTMLLKNLTHQALLHGHSARFTLASDMLHELAAQDSTIALARRLRRYTTPTILAIDEVGYLSYDARYADLLFEVVTRRYQQQHPVRFFLGSRPSPCSAQKSLDNARYCYDIIFISPRPHRLGRRRGNSKWNAFAKSKA